MRYDALCSVSAIPHLCFFHFAYSPFFFYLFSLAFLPLLFFISKICYFAFDVLFSLQKHSSTKRRKKDPSVFASS